MWELDALPCIVKSLFDRSLKTMGYIIIDISRHRAPSMCVISPRLQLLTSILCQQPFADWHSNWPEDVLYYVCRVSTQEIVMPIGYRFFDR